MSGSTQDAMTTTDTAANTATDPAATTSLAALDETANTADTAAESAGTTTEAAAPEAEAAPAAPAKPWDNAPSLDVHVKLEHLWAWAQAEMAKLHARIDALMGGQAQNVETTAEIPPAKEA